MATLPLNTSRAVATAPLPTPVTQSSKSALERLRAKLERQLVRSSSGCGDPSCCSARSDCSAALTRFKCTALRLYVREVAHSALTVSAELESSLLHALSNMLRTLPFTAVIALVPGQGLPGGEATGCKGDDPAGVESERCHESSGARVWNRGRGKGRGQSGVALALGLGPCAFGANVATSSAGWALGLWDRDAACAVAFSVETLLGVVEQAHYADSEALVALAKLDQGLKSLSRAESSISGIGEVVAPATATCGSGARIEILLSLLSERVGLLQKAFPDKFLAACDHFPDGLCQLPAVADRPAPETRHSLLAVAPAGGNEPALIGSLARVVENAAFDARICACGISGGARISRISDDAVWSLRELAAEQAIACGRRAALEAAGAGLHLELSELDADLALSGEEGAPLKYSAAPEVIAVHQADAAGVEARAVEEAAASADGYAVAAEEQAGCLLALLSCHIAQVQALRGRYFMCTESIGALTRASAGATGLVRPSPNPSVAPVLVARTAALPTFSSSEGGMAETRAVAGDEGAIVRLRGLAQDSKKRLARLRSESIYFSAMLHASLVQELCAAAPPLASLRRDARKANSTILRLTSLSLTRAPHARDAETKTREVTDCRPGLVDVSRSPHIPFVATSARPSAMPSHVGHALPPDRKLGVDTAGSVPLSRVHPPIATTVPLLGCSNAELTGPSNGLRKVMATSSFARGFSMASLAIRSDAPPLPAPSHNSSLPNGTAAHTRGAAPEGAVVARGGKSQRCCSNAEAWQSAADGVMLGSMHQLVGSQGDIATAKRDHSPFGAPTQARQASSSPTQFALAASLGSISLDAETCAMLPGACMTSSLLHSPPSRDLGVAPKSPLLADTLALPTGLGSWGDPVRDPEQQWPIPTLYMCSPPRSPTATAAA